MKKVFITISFLFFSSFFLTAQLIQIVLLRGVFAFEEKQVFALVNEFKNAEYNYFVQPKTNNEPVKGIAKDTDVLVFYDVWKTISRIKYLANSI
jgi:hypothetical protein